jgi:hypothetical protein
MSRKIYVTKAQQTAARMIVDRSAKSGKAVRSSISRIADASAKNLFGKSSSPKPATENG